MKDFKTIICILFFLVSGLSPAFNQPVENIERLSPNKLRNFGRNAARSGDVYTAINFLELYVKQRPNDIASVYLLADMYRLSRDYPNARDMYNKVLRNRKLAPKYPLAGFYYAQMLKQTGQCEEAKTAFTRFRSKYRGQSDDRAYSTLVRNEIQGCEIAQEIMNNPVKVSVEHLNSTVNRPHIELSPIPYGDGTFLYASLRMDSLTYFQKNAPATSIPVRQFYKAERIDNDWISGDEPYSGPFNIEGVETGNGALSRDGNRFYFTRCGKSWQGKNRCDIYLSTKVDGRWQEPVKLPPSINDPNYTATMPAIGIASRTGNEILYFVSDRPNGRGGMDIWYSIYNDKKKEFAAPRNAGSKVNTPGDEITPFYDHLSRSLYFSSNGQPGIGGFDIFQATGEMRKWLRVKNAGSPLNSTFDDLYFVLTPQREDGFFVSNRPGGSALLNETCCDDIYYFKYTDFIRLSVTGQIFPVEKSRFGNIMGIDHQASRIDYNTVDLSKYTPIEGAPLSLYMVDEETKELIFVDKYLTDKNGTYRFDLLPEQNYKFEIEGFAYFNEQIHLSTEMITFSFEIEMPPIWVNVLNQDPVVLANVYFDFNESNLTDASKKILDATLYEVLANAPNIIVEISAHTDSVGNYEYNKRLSQERAESVVAYMAQKGIAKNRMQAKGYGSEIPVAPNSLADGSDNPEGREKNRRVEFKVLGTIEVEEDMEDISEEE